jgi:hypothetical protein
MVKLGTSQTTMVEMTVSQMEQIIACTVTSRTMTRRVATSSRRRQLEMAMPVIFMVTLTGQVKRCSFHGNFKERDPKGQDLDLRQWRVRTLLQFR